MATIKNGIGTLCLAAFDEKADLKLHEIGRPTAGPNDIEIDILYCGMCHSDLHASNGDWSMKFFPIAPGHEIAGLVRAVGSSVTAFKVLDRVGVGCMVESCQKSCYLCHDGMENHCADMILTYGSIFPDGKGDHYKDAVGYHTNGGYSTRITVNEHFVFHIPNNMDLQYAGPLLCAGITTYSPLNEHILKKGGGKGKKVGVVGLGGLGHMAVKLAKAMDVDEVVCFSRNNNKQEDAKALGASLLVYTDEEALKEAFRSFDLIVDTVAVHHAVSPILKTLKVGGTYTILAGLNKPIEIDVSPMISNKHKIEGSLIGGVPETQEMLNFCSKHQIMPDIEIIHAKDASAHFKSMAAGTSGAKRAVIDMKTLPDLSKE